MHLNTDIYIMKKNQADDFLDITEAPSTYREILSRTGISRKDIERFCFIDNKRAALDFGITIALVGLSPLIYYYFDNFLGITLCILLNIHIFNRFAQIIHGSDHGWLFDKPKLNSFFGNLAASFLGYSRAGHQASHQEHHAHLNTELDSDRIWGYPDEKNSEILIALVKDFCGITALKRFLQYSQSDRKSYNPKPWEKLSKIDLKEAIKNSWLVILTQITLVTYYWILIGPQFYLLLYALPIITIYPAQIRLRSIVEHSYESKHYANLQESDGKWVTRSVNASLLERLIVAPLEIPYHFEHHLFPAVPYYNLAKLKFFLETAGFKIPMAPGYLKYIQIKLFSKS